MKRALCLLMLVPTSVVAQESTFVLGGIIDAYYAWDFPRPAARSRAFATEPARHNEFALNLALIRAQLANARVRGSLALATGTYVEANYAAEPDLLKNIFEGYAGVKLGANAWLDAGVLPSHIGFESAITSLNATYSRSLIAEFSPYYETGARLTVEHGEHFTGAILVLNGWQSIRETNDAKALGLQLQYRPSSRILLNYTNFLGNEAAADVGADEADRLFRFFNDFYAQLTLSTGVQLTAAFDVGTTEQPGQEDYVTWYGAAIVGRFALTPDWQLGARTELFHDPGQAVISTSTSGGFKAVGASLNLDHTPGEGVLLRLEARMLGAEDPVFPGRDQLERHNALITSSLAIAF